VAVGDFVKLARPGHWIKNTVVLLPILFGMRTSDADSWARIVWAAVAFCFVSSFGYIINDICDRQSDRNHPRKKDRPLAAGRVSVSAAVIEAIVFLSAGLVVAYCLSVLLLWVVAGYVVLGIYYTFVLKHHALVDVICIAMGFVLRAVAGAVAIGVVISPWLFICMFTICLFMGFCKRYSEIVTIGDVREAEGHRATLIEYTPELLTHLITLSAGIAVVGFLLYGLSERTIEQFGTNYFIYTLPIVVYGVFRFAMLSMKANYVDPTDLILHDSVFQMTVLLWVASAVVIIRWGRELASWIQGLN